MRKKIALIGLIAVLIFLGIFCYKTWFVAFAVTKYLSGRTEGKQGIVRSIIIPWRNYQLHLHHWLLALIVGGVFLVRGFYILTPEVFYGSLSAIVFQGIYCYGDWYRIIIRSRRMTPTSRGLLTGVLKRRDYGIDKPLPHPLQAHFNGRWRGILIHRNTNYLLLAFKSRLVAQRCLNARDIPPVNICEPVPAWRR